jgi:hypothetical protein
MVKTEQVVDTPSFGYPKLLLLLSLLGLIAVTSGCAALATLPLSSLIPSGGQGPTIYNTTQVRIEQRNFQVIKTNVVGTSKGFSLFGLITIVPARLTTAVNRFYVKAGMQPGQPQTLANLMTEQNSSFYLLFGIPRVTIRADVIEFTPPPPTVYESPPPETRPKTQQTGQ